MEVKRPCIWILLFFLSGLIMHKFQPFLLIIFLGILCIAIILWLYHLINRKQYDFFSFCFLLLLPVFFLLGYYLMNQFRKPHEMEALFTNKIKGTIIGKVKINEENPDYQVLLLEQCSIYIRDEDIEDTDQEEEKKSYNLYDKAAIEKNHNVSDSNNNLKDQIIYRKYLSEGVKVYYSLPLKSKIGNTISVEGEIIKFSKATNPGQFDEYQYNKMNHIDYKVYGNEIKFIDSNYSKYHNFIHRLKVKIFGIYNFILSEKNAGILSAMILGDKSILDQEVKVLYQQNGISHILAISGLHVSLIGMFFYEILRKVGCKIVVAVILSSIFLYSYGVLTGFSVSTNRAVFMLIILLLSQVIGRSYDLLSSMSISALLILMKNPLQLYSPGFLLSFGAVLAIGLIYPDLSKLFKVKSKLVKGVVDGLLISLSVQVMTLPILLYYFFEVSTYSILINVILLPFVSILIILAILGGIVGSVFLPLASIFLGGANYILNFYEWFLRKSNKLPSNLLLLGRPEFVIILTYYFILFFYIVINYWKEKKYSFILLIFLLFIFLPSSSSHLEITFLDVGQGDGIFLKSPEGRTYVIDGGSTSVKEVGKYRIIPYLKSKGIKEIDYVIISHFDFDHISGIIEIMEEMDDRKGINDIKKYSGKLSIKTLVVPDSNMNEMDEAYQNFISLGREKGIRILSLIKGDGIMEEELDINCLHPIKNFSYSTKNESSIVLDIRYKGFNLLLTGDVEGEGEKILNEVLNEQIGNGKEKETKYDILKVSHHGSKNSTYEEFLDLINPKYSIISSGKKNQYGHPHDELILRLKNKKSKIYYTMNQGAIMVRTDGELMKVRGYLED